MSPDCPSQDLVRHTPADHADYADLCAALSDMQEVAQKLNDRKRMAENRMRVVEINELFQPASVRPGPVCAGTC
jgi:hypothetical protein